MKTNRPKKHPKGPALDPERLQLLYDIRTCFGDQERVTTEALLEGLLAHRSWWRTANDGGPIDELWLTIKLTGLIPDPGGVEWTV
jgi:hypothetical protein